MLAMGVGADLWIDEFKVVIFHGYELFDHRLWDGGSIRCRCRDILRRT